MKHFWGKPGRAELAIWTAYILLKTAIVTAISSLEHGVDPGTVARGLENALQDAKEEL